MSDIDGDLRFTQDANDGLDDVERELVVALRKPVVGHPSLDARIMAAIQPGVAGVSSVHGDRGVRKSVRVVSIGLTGALLAAGAAFVLLTGRTRVMPASGGGVNSVETVAAAGHSRTVHFTLVQSGASNVSVAGSFNGWSIAATPLRRVSRDTWAADIPLDAGRYVYQFVIDGKRWVRDPAAPQDASDDFGKSNSVVTVAAAGSAL
ncbi:MAG: isoamylase early set domain-containing protein [Gemmatimonadota bacterium]|nr:isoamylase early set domain-containing protein [Gemmatimonadota bacterium]